MDKLQFIKASENHEHLKKHSDSSSLVIGSKALKYTNPEHIQNILARFDQAYTQLIDNHGNPGRREFYLKTNAPVGTDTIAATKDIINGSVFEVTRDLGTPYAAKVKVALINKENMPTTNLVHGIYGPYGNSGKAGIYTMTFGHPGMPFPKELSEHEPENVHHFNKECCKFWNGENDQDGHIFLATPEELDATIKQMQHHGVQTKIPELRLEAFYRGGYKSPLKESYAPSPCSENAVNLGIVKTVEDRVRQYE